HPARRGGDTPLSAASAASAVDIEASVLDDLDLPDERRTDRLADLGEQLLGHARVHRDDRERLAADLLRDLHALDVDPGVAKLLAVDGDDARAVLVAHDDVVL